MRPLQINTVKTALQSLHWRFMCSERQRWEFLRLVHFYIYNSEAMNDRVNRVGFYICIDRNIFKCDLKIKESEITFKHTQQKVMRRGITLHHSARAWGFSEVNAWLPHAHPLTAVISPNSLFSFPLRDFLSGLVSTLFTLTTCSRVSLSFGSWRGLPITEGNCGLTVFGEARRWGILVVMF